MFDNKAFRVHRTITDINNAFSPGIYIFHSGTANRPTSANNGFLLVFTSSGATDDGNTGWYLQIARDTQGGNLLTRTKSDSSSWSQWK